METRAQTLTAAEEEFDIVLGELEQDIPEARNTADYHYHPTTSQSWYCC